MTDNAADEVKAGKCLPNFFPNMHFHIMDTTHSLQLAVKHGVAGDPEVETLTQILLTNKRPVPSVSNMLRNSSRFRARFKDCQKDDVFGLLENLGYAPQRMSSRARPYGRCALKLRSLLEALADEAENGHDKEAALHNLQQLCSYKRLMLMGMLADLTHEHQRLVHATDTGDPDPTALPLLVGRFKQRCTVLFIEGAIMERGMQDTFTYSVYAFMRSPNILFYTRHGSMLAMPPAADRVATFEPLQRIRGIVRNILVSIDAALPSNSWQWTFGHFALPGIWKDTQPNDEQVAKTLVELEGFFVKAGHENAKNTVREIRTLGRSACKFLDHGMTIRQAWALASVDFPEKKGGRAAVSFLLGALHTTGNVERSLKDTALQYTPERARLLGTIVSDLAILAVHAPPVQDLASSVEVAGKKELQTHGPYISNVIGAYTFTYKGRRCKKPHKARRDKGMSHRQSKDKVTEADFLRRREQCVQQRVLEASHPGQGSARMSFRGSSIMKDDPSKDTPAMLAVREKASKRESLKRKKLVEPLPQEPRPTAMVKRRRWSADPMADCGKTQSNKRQHNTLVLLDRRVANDTQTALTMRLFRTTTNWSAYMKELQKAGPKSATKAMVIAAHPTDTVLKMQAQLLGGFFTCEQWVAQALRERAHKSPQGMFYTGMNRSKAFKVWLSTRLSETTDPDVKPVCDTLQAMCDPGSAWNLERVQRAERLAKHHRRYVRESGPRSRLGTSMVAVCLDLDDKRAMTRTHFPQ